MIKITVKKYTTLYEFIKNIKKGKYDNTTKFIADNTIYDIDTYFEEHHCNFHTLNSEIEILRGEDNG